MAHNENDLSLLTHAVYSPKNSSNIELPTIILLHGYGAHGLDLLPLAPHLWREGPRAKSVWGYGGGRLGFPTFVFRPKGAKRYTTPKVVTRRFGFFGPKVSCR